MRDHLAGGGSGVGAPGISWAGAPAGAGFEGVILPQREQDRDNPNYGQEVPYTSGAQTDTDGTVKTFPDGKERTQAIFLVQTPWRNREGLSRRFLEGNPAYQDDGVRAYYMDGKEESADGRNAVRAGLVQIGSYIKVNITELKNNPKGVEPIKIRGAQFRPPDEQSMTIVAQYRAAHPTQDAGHLSEPPAAQGWGQPEQGQQPGWGGQQAPPQQPGWGGQQAPPQQPGWGGQAPQGPPPQQPQPQGPPPQQPGWGGQQAPPQGPPPQQWGGQQGQPADPPF